MALERITLAAAAMAVVALGCGDAIAQERAPRRGSRQGDAGQKAVAPAPEIGEQELVDRWRELTAERTAHHRVFVSPDGAQRRSVTSFEPRWDPVTGARISADLRFEGTRLASDQGDVRIEVPLAAGREPARMVLDTGEAIELSTRVRLVHRYKGAERGFARDSGDAEGVLERGAAVRYAEVMPGADLLVESRPGEVESSLVLTRRPDGLTAGGAVYFEEAITLPAGWTVEGLDAALESGIVPGISTGAPETGFSRIDARLNLLDSLGSLRATIEQPRVFEAAAPKADSGTFAEVRFDAALRTITYRTSVPASWLADPTRRFPVVFDPSTLTRGTPLVISYTLGQTDVWTITPRSNFWNVVGVSAAGSADYDIAAGGASGIASPPFLDLVIADGNQGTITPATGTATLFVGSTSTGAATLQHSAQDVFSLGAAKSFSFSSSDVIYCMDIDFLSGTPGTRQMRVDGPTGLSWAVFPPGASSGTSAWDDEFAAVSFASVGTTESIDFNVNGYWSVIVVEDGGPGLSGTVSVTWPAPAGVALVQDTAQSVTATTSFSLTPQSGYWNAVGVFQDDWDISIGGASSVRFGSTTDFCVADGNQSASSITVTSGTLTRIGSSPAGIAEHSGAPTGGSILPGTPTTRPWNATDVLRIYEVNPSVNGFGTYTMTVGGVSSVRCAIFPPAASDAWQSRSAALQEFAVGVPTNISFSAGLFWSLVVFRDSATAPSGVTLTIDWGSTSNPLPATTSISPTSVTAGAAQFPLTVNGTNFIAGSEVRVNGVSRTTTFNSATQLTATILAADVAAAGTRSITVFNASPGGGTSNAQTLTINAAPSNPVPSITSISPSSVTAGAAQFTLTVRGSNFVGGSTVRANGAALSTTFVSAITLTALVPAGTVSTPQTIAITVFSSAPGGGTSSAVNLTVDPQPTNPVPSITSISPSAVTAGATQFNLVVTGSSFVSGAAVRVGGSSRTTTFNSATQLTAVIPATDVATSGTLAITVFNPAPGGGTSTTVNLAVNPATNPAPTLAAIAPNSVVAGSGQFTLTATGSGFVAGQSVLRVNGNARTTTVSSTTTLTATILSTDVASATTLTITVFTPAPGGGTSGSQALTVSAGSNPAPTLASISPSSVTAGAAQFTLTANGSSFVAGATVRVNGAARATTFVSATQLTATILASDVATAGTPQITVFNPTPGGGTSAAQTLTVNAPPQNPVPSITSLSPSQVFAGSPAFSLQVDGTGFVAGSVVRVNGAARTTTFVSPSRLDAAILAADVAAAATLQISVFNPAPGGGTSASSPLDVQGATPSAPVLSSISPSSVAVGGASFTLAVTGSNFGVTCVVRLNGAALPTTFVSTTGLTATVSAANIATIGNKSITVFDGTTSLSSGSLTLAVTGSGGGLVGSSGSGGGGGGCAITASPAGGAEAAGAMLPWAALVALATTRARRRRSA